jgi:adenosyl cobinamide kinase/adenosyl cobinamide phosphate guanylyltransferase
MILIIGAESSGKGAYARGLNLRNVEYNVHERVFANPGCVPELLERLCIADAVTCNEVGSGVIPIDRCEREAGEATGRLCVLLAQQAERVVRMVAGIPVTIKQAS